MIRTKTAPAFLAFPPSLAIKKASTKRKMLLDDYLEYYVIWLGQYKLWHIVIDNKF